MVAENRNMIKPDIQQIKQRFGIIGNAPGLFRAVDIALQVAPTDLSVLVTGESGTGKEFFPQIIHQYSSRKHGRYIAVNCGAIPEGTIDSELFGHEKGSFTGALSDRKGYFEEADGGTIFLDEVGELPLTTQARLLRVLETGEFIKVGSSKVLKTNVRIVAATNLNMAKAISSGKFREDLFYRLNTVPIQIPPLRERTEDILLLFRKFSNDFAEKYRMPPIQLTEGARHILTSYEWPGNVRQLKNITEQISIIETSREVTADMLKLYIPEQRGDFLPAVSDSYDTRFGHEREVFYQVILEMRKELNDLKAVVHQLMSNRIESVSRPVLNADIHPAPNITVPSLKSSFPVIDAEPEFVASEPAYEEESVSLEDAEREMIRKALERNNGKRKKTAEELKISERTLYRKIKEYKLD